MFYVARFCKYICISVESILLHALIHSYVYIAKFSKHIEIVVKNILPRLSRSYVYIAKYSKHIQGLWQTFFFPYLIHIYVYIAKFCKYILHLVRITVEISPLPVPHSCILCYKI